MSQYYVRYVAVCSPQLQLSVLRPWFRSELQRACSRLENPLALFKSRSIRLRGNEQVSQRIPSAQDHIVAVVTPSGRHRYDAPAAPEGVLAVDLKDLCVSVLDTALYIQKKPLVFTVLLFFDLLVSTNSQR